jgi:hypothetical protein
MKNLYLLENKGGHGGNIEEYLYTAGINSCLNCGDLPVIGLTREDRMSFLPSSKNLVKSFVVFCNTCANNMSKIRKTEGKTILEAIYRWNKGKEF